jgi:hypothetical protein
MDSGRVVNRLLDFTPLDDLAQSPYQSRKKRNPGGNAQSAADRAFLHGRSMGKVIKVLSPTSLGRVKFVVSEEKMQESFPQAGQFFEPAPMPGIGPACRQRLHFCPPCSPNHRHEIQIATKKLLRTIGHLPMVGQNTPSGG